MKENTTPEIVRQCLQFLQSEAVFLILSNLTGLSLHALAANKDSDSELSDTGSYTELAPRNRCSRKEKSRDQSTSKEETGSSSGSEAEEEKKLKPKKKRRRLNSKDSEDGKTIESSSQRENSGQFV